jgi:hypothetical protein
MLSFEAAFIIPKQQTKKRQRELSPASKADVVQFARKSHPKTLLSLALYAALHCPHARPASFHLAPLHAEQRTDLGENISDMVGGREHLAFGYGMAQTTWNPRGFQPNVRINFELSIMCFSRSRTSSPSGSQIIS